MQHYFRFSITEHTYLTTAKFIFRTLLSRLEQATLNQIGTDAAEAATNTRSQPEVRRTHTLAAQRKWTW